MQSQFAFNFAPGHGETSPPRADLGGYPLDLDGSLRYLTPAMGFTTWPEAATYPNGDGIGCVSGLMPQQDKAVYAQLIARVPGSPSTNPFLNTVSDPMEWIIQATFPQLPQYGTPDRLPGGLQ